MDGILIAYLAGRRPFWSEECLWANGQIHLRVDAYLCGDPPPLELVNSARAIVLRSDDVLVLRNGHETHVVPGGRREPGEALEQTVRREIAEETGWTVGELRRIGFWHFHHLTPRPPDYQYLYPDFLNVLFAAEAVAERPDLRLTDDYEVEAGFRPLEDVRALPLASGQHVFLEEALRRR